MRWYSAKVTDRNCLFYVATNENGNPFGQIRFEMTGLEAVVSLSLAPHARGKGLGPALIVQGAEQFMAQSKAEVVHAYIKTDNPASVRSFENAGFKDAGTTDIIGHRARHFELHRETT